MSLNLFQNGSLYDASRNTYEFLGILTKQRLARIYLCGDLTCRGRRTVNKRSVFTVCLVNAPSCESMPGVVRFKTALSRFSSGTDAVLLSSHSASAGKGGKDQKDATEKADLPRPAER